MSPLRFGHSPMSMSPPGASMISLEELKQVAETAANYKLVHEISTEPDFKLSPRTVDPNRLLAFSEYPVLFEVFGTSFSSWSVVEPVRYSTDNIGGTLEIVSFSIETRIWIRPVYLALRDCIEAAQFNYVWIIVSRRVIWVTRSTIITYFFVRQQVHLESTYL